MGTANDLSPDLRRKSYGKRSEGKRVRQPPRLRIAGMSAPVWQALSCGHWYGNYRGIVIRIKVQANKAWNINFYASRRLSDSAPVDCSVEMAKLIAVTLIDKRIPQDFEWEDAEEREHRARFSR